MKRFFFTCLGFSSLILSGCGYRNVETPAGYVGYITKGAVFGKAEFVGTQVGPTSTGMGFLYDGYNISVTPYTFNEDFSVDNHSGVLAKDQLPMSLGVHTTFEIDPDKVKDFVEKYSTLVPGNTPDQIVRTAYDNYVKEPVRTFARSAVEAYNGIDVQSNTGAITSAISEKLQAIVKNTPFKILNVVVGNIQYPTSVTDAIAEKIAANQKLQTMAINVTIARQQAAMREAEALGIASAMKTINEHLTPEYIQYEAIKAQLSMVNSPNHTTIYIPVGPMGVPLVGTVGEAETPAKKP